MRSWDDYKKTMIREETLGSAAKENKIGSLLALLNQGQDINAKDHRGYSPLMLAAYAGSAEAVTLLLARGADANTSDPAGNTVLMGASFKGHLQILKSLLEAGADVNHTNHAGMTAADFAKTFGRTEVLEYLRKHQVVPRNSSRIKNLIDLSISTLKANLRKAQ